jgi:hypothetical protein
MITTSTTIKKPLHGYILILDFIDLSESILAEPDCDEIYSLFRAMKDTTKLVICLKEQN